MLAGFLALVILVITLFPTTDLARSLHRWLVEWPLEFAHRIERRHLILLAILLCAGQTLALMGSAELAMAYAIDTSLYLDAIMASYLAAATARFKSAVAAVKDAFARVVRRAARPRARARKTRSAALRPPKPGNDDDPAWLLTAQVA